MSKPMVRRLLAEGWTTYRRDVVGDAGPIQVAETEKAFYAGAAYLFYAIANILEEGKEATANDMAQMNAIVTELEEHVKGVLRKAGL